MEVNFGGKLVGVDFQHEGEEAFSSGDSSCGLATYNAALFQFSGHKETERRAAAAAVQIFTAFAEREKSSDVYIGAVLHTGDTSDC